MSQAAIRSTPREGQLLDCRDRVLHALEVDPRAARLDRLRACPTSPRQPSEHRLEIEPDGEVRPARREDQHADLGVLAEGGTGARQVRPQVRAEGVAGLRAVEPQRGDRAVHVDAEHWRLEVIHGGHDSSSVRPPWAYARRTGDLPRL